MLSTRALWPIDLHDVARRPLYAVFRLLDGSASRRIRWWVGRSCHDRITLLAADERAMVGTRGVRALFDPPAAEAGR